MLFTMGDDLEQEWRSIELEEEAVALWIRGYLEEALPLAQESVRLREESWTICWSLNVLGGIYLEMLKINEAEETANRILREAHRYDDRQQTRLAHLLLEDAQEDRRHGFYYGDTVKLHGLAKEEMNGQLGEIRGRKGCCENLDRYHVLVGTRMLSIRRRNISLATVVVQIILKVDWPRMRAVCRTLQGGPNTTCNIAYTRITHMKVASARLQVAEYMKLRPSDIQLVLPDGQFVQDGAKGDAALQNYAACVHAVALHDAGDAAVDKSSPGRAPSEKAVCLACLDNEPVWKYMACAHLVYCKSCMKKMRKKSGSKASLISTCPMCRGPGPPRLQA